MNNGAKKDMHVFQFSRGRGSRESREGTGGEGGEERSNDLGPVVRKPIKANPRLQVNRGSHFGRQKRFTKLVLRLVKTEGQNVSKNL